MEHPHTHTRDIYVNALLLDYSIAFELSDCLRGQFQVLIIFRVIPNLKLEELS
jgi:hypothetical protein